MRRGTATVTPRLACTRFRPCLASVPRGLQVEHDRRHVAGAAVPGVVDRQGGEQGVQSQHLHLAWAAEAVGGAPAAPSAASPVRMAALDCSGPA